jgi:altronate dehydratase small subunit
MTAIKIHQADNVATLISDVVQGAEVCVISSDGDTVQRLKAKNTIPQAHKLALAQIEQDADIIKYGEVIGRAIQPVEEGMHVHVHNVESKRVR